MQVRLVEHDPRGKLRSRTLFPGSFFNQDRALGMAWRGGIPFSATAATRATLLRVTEEDFEAMKRADAPLYQQLLLAVLRQSELQKSDRVRPVPTHSTILYKVMLCSLHFLHLYNVCFIQVPTHSAAV